MVNSMLCVFTIVNIKIFLESQNIIYNNSTWPKISEYVEAGQLVFEAKGAIIYSECLYTFLLQPLGVLCLKNE